MKPESIQELKSLIKIEDEIKDVVIFKKKGANLVGLCPFHNEKTPSFTVSKSAQSFKCFGCGISGDVIEFIQLSNNLSFMEAVKKLANKYNFKGEVEDDTKSYELPQPRLEKLNKSFIDWFEKRGISNNTLLRFGITEAIEWMPGAKSEVRVICFNYFMYGALINIKFRGPQKEFKLSKGGKLIFYNIDAIENDKIVIIVEGEPDCLAMYEAGFHNVISVPNGASGGSDKLIYLDNCYQYFTDKEKIIIMTDNDAPGYNLREELACRLGKHRCYKVEYPENCKDANDVLLKYGKNKICEMVGACKEWPIEGVLTMDDMFDDEVQYYHHGYPQGFKVGVNELDELISFMPGQFTTVTGIPGSGKSEFVDYLMTLLTLKHNWPFAVCSFENQPSAIHVTKLMEKFAGKSFAHRKDIGDRMTYEQVENSALMVDKYYHFINISQVDVTLTGILQKAEELVVRKGIKGLLIDPWNYIEHKNPYGYTETQYISESLTAIKTFCLKQGVHVFLIAHPTKIQKDKQSGNYEVPTLYNISGSAHSLIKLITGSLFTGTSRLM